MVETIHSQMNQEDHFEERATSYEAKVVPGFRPLRAGTFSIPAHEKPRPFRANVDEKLLIRGMLFTGFKKCLYQAQRFDSDTERRFAILLEDDPAVLKWIKPSKKELEIYYQNDKVYEPDFIVETTTGKWLCEPKRASEMIDPTVLAKARAAATWCRQATTATKDPWVLPPHPPRPNHRRHDPPWPRRRPHILKLEIRTHQVRFAKGRFLPAFILFIYGHFRGPWKTTADKSRMLNALALREPLVAWWLGS
jgi:hypothetical protein